MARTIGPIQGAGTQVTERDAPQSITPASIGWSAYAGLLERGPTNELIWAFSKTDAIRKTGGLIKDSHLPDCIRDYFDLAAGAGGLLLVRVTDGTELPASKTIYTRNATSRVQLGRIEAKNGGKWGGSLLQAAGQVADEAVDITETTVTTGVTTWNEDQWAGANLRLAGVPNTTYPVLSSTAAGVLTVASDMTMASDLAGGADVTNDWYDLEFPATAGKGLSVKIDDGENDPDNEFSLAVTLDGVEVKPRWDNLSADPASPRYWVDIINTDSANEFIKAVDVYTGTRTAATRPANLYGNHNTLAATVLTADVHEFVIAGSGDPTVALGTISSEDREQVLTLTLTDPTSFDVVSDLYGAVGSGVMGSEFDSDVPFVPAFTVTAGGTPMVAAETLTLVFKPVGAPNELVGGVLFPDKVQNPTNSYRIIGNTYNTITVAVGSDMATDVSGGGTAFMVVGKSKLAGGRDGNAGVDDNDYVQAYDVDNSLFLQMRGKNLGLVKLACPGVTSTAVQKAGAAFVSSLVAGAHQWRYDIPSNLTTEAGIENHVNKTLGKSPYGDFCVTGPSFVYVNDTEAPGKLKLISSTGMIHGREASIAANYGGYHKAEAGVAATLPRIVKLTTGERLLNEEFLNPRGINIIKLKNGNFVLHGNKTVTSNTGWQFKHKREVMSYYINSLSENFDFTLFEFNDPDQWDVIRGALLTFFNPEYTKRALDNTYPFDEALEIKIDQENNTGFTQSLGDVHADINVRIVNSIERLRIGLSKAGVIDTSA